MKEEEEDGEEISVDTSLGHESDETHTLIEGHSLGAPLPPPATSTRKNFLYGLLCITSVAVIWVAAGELAQYVFLSLHINEPVFLTYINVSEFLVLLPVAYLREVVWGVSPPSDWRTAAKYAAMVCPLWFFAQGSYNMSIVFTTVSSSTALSATSCVFTFLLTLCLLRRGGTLATALGVGCTVVGGMLVGYGDQSSSSAPRLAWVGNTLALFSAAAYASYSMAIKMLVPGEEEGEIKDGAAVKASADPAREAAGGSAVAAGGGAGLPLSMLVFFGFLGLWTSLGLLPIVITLHATNVENLSGWAGNGSAILLVLLKGLFDNVLSDLLWAKAIQLTSPTFAAVGLSLTIPLAVLSDFVLDGILPSPLGGGGAVCVFIGFVFCALGERASTTS